MPIEEVAGTTGGFATIFSVFSAAFLVKIFAVLFVIFYIFFALILFRQIQLMDRAIPTPIGPFLKFIGIIQIGVALSFLFVVIGVF